MLETVSEAVLSVVGISTGASKRSLLFAAKLILEFVSVVIDPAATKLVPNGGGTEE